MLPNFKLSYYNFFIPHPDRNIYILYNALSNAMIELEWEQGIILSKLNSMEIHFLDEEIVSQLKDNGMIIPLQIDEFDVVRERANSNREMCERSDTLFMVISPTNSCNMNCPYCYQGDKTLHAGDTKYLGKENMEALKKTIAKIVYEPHAMPIKKINIEWFGGEPLVQKKTIGEFSDFVIALANENNIEYRASIITNGTLLDEKTYELLEQCKVQSIQITIDGDKSSHDSMRYYLNGKGTYERILKNLKLMPKDKFNVTIRINGDRTVFSHLPQMFDDFSEYGLWPQRYTDIRFDWVPKFYNYLGYNQDKEAYYTSYEFQKSKEDFSKLKLEKYNAWANSQGRKNKILKVKYPTFAEFYCGTVESPNSISVDDAGYLHKCYNTINNEEKRIHHVSEFDPTADEMNYYKKIDKTREPDCRTCKVLPICEESCNMRFVSRAESKICSGWKYFMEERMVALYEENFAETSENTADVVLP